MEEEVNHPVEGDTLILTDTVYSRKVLGTTLPCGYKLADSDQRFDSYEVEVVNRDTQKVRGSISRETLTIKTEDGDVTEVTYRGREPIAGTAGECITEKNSQNAEQAYTWHKA
jgi:hypothetical protein